MSARRRRRARLRLRQYLLLLLLALFLWLLMMFLGERPGDPEGGGEDLRRPGSAGEAAGDTQSFSLTALSAPRPPSSSSASSPDEHSSNIASAGRSLLFGRILERDGSPSRQAMVEVLPAVNDVHLPGLGEARALATARTDDEGNWHAVVESPRGGKVRAIVRIDGVAHLGDPFDASPRTVVEAPRIRLIDAAPLTVDLKSAPTGRVTIALRPRAEIGGTAAPLRWTEKDGIPAATLLEGFPYHEADAVPADGRIVLKGVGAGRFDIIARCGRHIGRAVGSAGESIAIEFFDPGASRTMDNRGGGADGVQFGPLPLFARLSADEISSVPARAFDPSSRLWQRSTLLAPLENRLEGEVIRAIETGTVEATGNRTVMARALPTDPGRDERDALLTSPDSRISRLATGRYRVRTIDSDGREEDHGEMTVSHDALIKLKPGSMRVIRGRVRDGGRVAIPGARVAVGRSLAAVDAYLLPWVVTTDAEGRFEFEGLAAGDFDIVINASGFAPHSSSVTLDTRPDAEVSRTIELEAGPDLVVVFEDPRGVPHAYLDVAVVTRNGITHRARADANGRAEIGPLSPGPHVVLPVLGRLGEWHDSWEWLRTASGGRVVDPMRTDRVEWTLPTTIPLELDVSVVGGHEIELEITHPGMAVAPGVWPKIDLGVVRPGRIRIDRMLPGRYTAIAYRGDRKDVKSFTLEENGAVVSLAFKLEKKR